MNHRMNNRFREASKVEQIAAEESAYFQNKAHSARWHCRIGKIRAKAREVKLNSNERRA